MDKNFKPYIPADKVTTEMTPASVILGIVLAVVLTATIITIASSGRHKTPTAEPQDVTPEDAWQFEAEGGYNAVLKKYIAGTKEKFRSDIPVYKESDLFGRSSWVFLCVDTSV